MNDGVEDVANEDALDGGSIRVLFVCMGNICRSPLAEGVFRAEITRRELTDRFEIDSAGTGAWHVGEPPDRRMRETASRHGISLDGQSARQFSPEDLDRFDYIFAMDRDNLHDILAQDPDGSRSNLVRLFREFDPEPGSYQVPDPYYGGERGFEDVFDIVQRTARMLADRLAETHAL